LPDICEHSLDYRPKRRAPSEAWTKRTHATCHSDKET
jgi:hypothetical protein